MSGSKLTKSRKKGLKKQLLEDSSDEEDTPAENKEVPSVEKSVEVKDGLPLDIQKELIQKICAAGGFAQLTTDTNILSTILKSDTNLFGAPERAISPRKRRKQCRNFVSHLKLRHKDPVSLHNACQKILNTKVFQTKKKTPPPPPPPPEPTPLPSTKKQKMTSKEIVPYLSPAKLAARRAKDDDSDDEEEGAHCACSFNQMILVVVSLIAVALLV